MYTGLNDQILKADISYNAGQLLLGAPGGGLIGDTSTSPNKPGAPSGDGDYDGKSAKADVAAKQEDVAGILDSFNNDDTMQRVGDTLGLTSTEMAALRKNDKEGKQRRAALAEAVIYLNNNGQNPLGYHRDQQGKIDPSQPMTGEEVNTTTPYTPEPSGYIYGADLLDDAGGSETVIGELSGQQAINTLIDTQRGDISTDPKPSFDYTKSIVATGGNTSDGTPKATLFGYMYKNYFF